MKVLSTSKELSKKEAFALANDAGKLSEIEGETIEVAAYMFYEDTDSKTGEVKKILAIKTAEGLIYGTNSETFQKKFSDIMTNVYDDDSEPAMITIVSGVSKAGRKYIDCKVA